MFDTIGNNIWLRPV